MRLYDIIKALQNADGNLAKQAILEANKDNDLFREYMKATYDVGLSYYQKKIAIHPSAPAGNHPLTLFVIRDLIESLAMRKITGEAAKKGLAHVALNLDAEGRELLGYIINRSIGASVGDTMVLNTWPGLYFIPPYMRCSSMSEKAREQLGKEDSFYVQVKRDGSFAYMNPGRICTRQGSCYPDWFVGLMTSGLGNNEVLVGEMEVYRVDAATDAGLPVLLSRKEGNGVLNSILQGADESEFAGYIFRYVAWDCLSLGEFEMGRSERPYNERLEHLKMGIDMFYPHIELIQTWEVKSVAEAKKIHTSLTARGLEGSVWKRKQGIWRDTSSGTIDAVKVKVVAEAEFRIVGSYEGTGKAKGMLGGITVETECGKLHNDCGTGFSDDDRKKLWLIRDSLPGNIVTLEFNDITTARGKATVSLSLPVYIEIRFDRTVADTLERVYEQFEAAKQGK